MTHGNCDFQKTQTTNTAFFNTRKKYKNNDYRRLQILCDNTPLDGRTFINNYNDDDMTVPWGGFKQSGNGSDKSFHALDKFSELKMTWIDLSAR